MSREAELHRAANGHNIHFSDLRRKYDEIAAMALLMEMERHVGMNSALLAGVDPECRLQVALALMNGTAQTAAAA